MVSEVVFLAELAAYQSAYGTHVDTALGFAFKLAHYLTHVFHLTGAGGGHYFIDERGDFFGLKLFWQVMLQHFNFSFFFLSQLGTLGVAVLLG